MQCGAHALPCGPAQSLTGRRHSPLLSFANEPRSFTGASCGLTSESKVGCQPTSLRYRDGGVRAPCLMGVLRPLKNILFLGEEIRV